MHSTTNAAATASGSSRSRRQPAPSASTLSYTMPPPQQYGGTAAPSLNTPAGGFSTFVASASASSSEGRKRKAATSAETAPTSSVKRKTPTKTSTSKAAASSQPATPSRQKKSAQVDLKDKRQGDLAFTYSLHHAPASQVHNPHDLAFLSVLPPRYNPTPVQPAPAVHFEQSRQKPVATGSTSRSTTIGEPEKFTYVRPMPKPSPTATQAEKAAYVKAVVSANPHLSIYDFLPDSDEECEPREMSHYYRKRQAERVADNLAAPRYILESPYSATRFNPAPRHPKAENEKYAQVFNEFMNFD